MEPWVYDLSKKWGVKTWGEWAEPNCNKFLAVRGRKFDCHNNAFWQLEQKLNDFSNSSLFEKNKGSNTQEPKKKEKKEYHCDTLEQ